MKDIFGNELDIGDTVAFNQPKYKNLVKGKIIALTKKQIRIQYQDHCKQINETLEYPRDCVKDMSSIIEELHYGEDL